MTVLLCHALPCIIHNHSNASSIMSPKFSFPVWYIKFTKSERTTVGEADLVTFITLEGGEELVYLFNFVF